jgi:type II secretory pathway component PulF
MISELIFKILNFIQQLFIFYLFIIFIIFMLLQYINDQDRTIRLCKNTRLNKNQIIKCLYHGRRLLCAHAQTGLYSSGNILAAK